MTGSVLCCDVGGSGLRAGLVDDAGALIAAATVPIPVVVGREGESELDPAMWWRGFGEAAAQLERLAPGALAGVEAIAVCGMTRTQILVDRHGQAVRPAITWRDTRAQAVAREIGTAGTEAIDAFHPAARLAWIERFDADAFRQSHRVLDPKDFIALRLTGRAASDPISLARLVAATDDGHPELSRFRALVPDLVAPGAWLGTVLAGLPDPLAGLAGRPVFMASNDTWTAVLGLGALRPGMAYTVSGTSEVFGVVSDRPARAEGLLHVVWGEGLHQLGGPSQNGADVVPWLLAILGAGPGDVEASLARALGGARAAQPVLFLPFLQGERVPYWDESLRGAFLGLARGHGPADLAWAVLEGLAFANRVVLERAEAATGAAVREIRLGGGAARNPVWCQVRADICERPVVRGACDEPGLLGCAVVAFAGLGRFPSLGAAQDVLARPDRRYEPRADAAADYRALHRLYREAVDAAAPLSRRLAAARAPAAPTAS